MREDDAWRLFEQKQRGRDGAGEATAPPRPAQARAPLSACAIRCRIALKPGSSRAPDTTPPTEPGPTPDSRLWRYGTRRGRRHAPNFSTAAITCSSVTPYFACTCAEMRPCTAASARGSTWTCVPRDKPRSGRDLAESAPAGRFDLRARLPLPRRRLLDWEQLLLQKHLLPHTSLCDNCHASGAPRLHLGCTSAAPRPHLGCTSAAPRLNLG